MQILRLVRSFPLFHATLLVVVLTFTVVQPLYTPLVLGSIKPLGWFKDELHLEADGLSGNMFDFYRFVNDSRWIGGQTEYSALDEASPYWFNAIVPLAFGLGDERLTGQVCLFASEVP